jgi:hypothetical protein
VEQESCGVGGSGQVVSRTLGETRWGRLGVAACGENRREIPSVRPAPVKRRREEKARGAVLRDDRQRQRKKQDEVQDKIK